MTQAKHFGRKKLVAGLILSRFSEVFGKYLFFNKNSFRVKLRPSETLFQTAGFFTQPELQSEPFGGPSLQNTQA